MANSASSWRVIDIVTAAVLGVACGLIFFVWNSVGGNLWGMFDSLTPGLGGLAVGIWLLGGVLGGLIIRKPGAALFVEVLAATVSMAIGSQWGISTIYSGIAQGLGAGIVFALFGYKRFDLPVAMLAGAGAGIGAWTLEMFVGDTPNYMMGFSYNAIYLVSLIITGLFLAGLVAWLLTRALASTGVLDRFAAGANARVVD
ncbi:ECF transporter S component [Boudabousia tangfeifanii]|nr:ECF transporter S component [Boudabousia tangfeifanii]